MKENTLLALKNRSGKILTTLEVPAGSSKEEIVFQILDKALGVEIQGDDGGRAFYGFINPFTKQIALGSVPETKAYDGSDLLDIEATGRWLDYSSGVLSAKGTILRVLEPDYTLIKSIINNN